jgi:hypothetical protein
VTPQPERLIDAGADEQAVEPPSAPLIDIRSRVRPVSPDGEPAVRLGGWAMMERSRGVALPSKVSAATSATPEPALPAPFGPARNGALVYSADGDVYRLGTADGVPSVIIGGPTDDHDPLFSRDGSKFLFRRSAESIFEQVGVASADGSDPRIVTGDVEAISALDWSPDGSQFAMVHTLLGLRVVSIVDATG